MDLSKAQLRALKIASSDPNKVVTPGKVVKRHTLKSLETLYLDPLFVRNLLGDVYPTGIYKITECGEGALEEAVGEEWRKCKDTVFE